MRKIISLFYVLVFLFIFTSFGYSQTLGVGDQISSLHLKTFLQAPRQHYDYKYFKGQALVLEFWATWCAPCIELIPHLNHLESQFENKPIHFISITTEKESIVQHFLKQHTINGWIGIDKNRSVDKKFGITYIPQTVLIRPSGTIAAITRANKVHAKTLERLINGDSLEIRNSKISDNSTEKTKKKADNHSSKPNPLLKIKIHKTDKQAGSRLTNTSSGIYFSSSITVNELLQTAYQIGSSRIVAPDSIKSLRLYVSIKAPKNRGKRFYKVMQVAIKAALGLKIEKEKRNKVVYVLSAPNGVIKGLSVHNSKVEHTSHSDDVIAASGTLIKGLIEQLESLLGVPVIDKTNLHQRYSWTVTFDGNNKKSLIPAIHKQLGLQLTKKRKNVKMLIVTYE